MSENTPNRVVCYVVTSAGLELVGFVEYESAPKIDEHGNLVTNSALGSLIGIDQFWLYKPVKAQLAMTQHGPKNVLISLLQITAKPDDAKVLIRRDQIIFSGRAKEDVEQNYLEGMSGIALPKSGGGLIR